MENDDALSAIRSAWQAEIDGAEGIADPNIPTDDKDAGKPEGKVPAPEGTPGEKQLTPAQEQALSEGWMDKEDWVAAGLDPDLWKPAGAYLADGELRKELRGLKRAVKKRDKVIDTMLQERDLQYKAGYQQALRDKTRERDQAVEEGDLKKVVELSDEIAEIKAKATPPKIDEGVDDGGEGAPVEFSVEEQKGIRKWSSQNPWYIMDKQMGQYADIIATQYLDENEGASVVDALHHAAKVVRAQFPSRFRGAATSAPAVDTGTANKGPSKPAESPVLKPRELLSMENGEFVYGIYKNYKSAGMFKKDSDDKNGKWTYDEWARSIGAVRE